MPSSRRKSVQQGAHAFTILSMFWTLFSAYGFFDWFGYPRTINDPNAIPDLVIWALHLLFIGLAIYLFRKEKKREGLWIGYEDEILEPVPQEANIPYVRARLGTEIRRNLKLLPRTISPFIFFVAFINLTTPAMRINDTLMLVGLLLLLLSLQAVGSPLYKYFAIVSRHKEFEKQQRNSL